jgi:serine/threonine-protein kinase
MSGLQDSLYLQGLLRREYATDREIKKCLHLQNAAYRAGERSLDLLDVLTRENYVSRSQADRIRHDIEEGRNFNLHVPGYRILEKVGEGGMGVVYRARQSSLQRDVALKVLRADYSADQAFLDRFLREAVATAQANHPHIVGVIDVGMEAEGRWYIVMEFIEGVDLMVELQKRKRIEEIEAARIALDVARALGHIHRLGFIHRDVKPQNIMVTKDRIAKLTDMGLARMVGDMKMIRAERGKALGTPDYISPEQVRGESNLDFRVDMYALGGTLYHLLTGRVPFISDTPAKVMAKHVEERLVPARELVPGLTGGLSEIIEVLMAKRRSDRYASMEDLMLDLDAVINGGTAHFAYEKLRRDPPPPRVPEPTDSVKSRIAAADVAKSAPKAAASASSGRPLLMALIVLSILANLVIVALFVLREMQTGT